MRRWRARGRAAVGLAAAFALAACGTTLHDPREVTGPATADPGGGVASAPLDGTGTTLVGGGSGPATGVGGAASPGGGATATTAPGARGPANTDPISIGFLVTETGNAGQFGVSVGQSFSHRQIVDALVASMNAQGGLAGRKIQPVIDAQDTASISWESDFATACAAMTQDNHVAAVLGYAFAFFPSFEACLAKAGISHITSAYNISDAAGFNQFPNLFSTAAPVLDRYFPTVIGGAVKYGHLTKGSKLGVVIPECAPESRAWAGAGAATAKQLGITTYVEKVSCPSGSAGVSSVVTQLQSAALKLRSNGVDVVSVEGPALLIFAASAESQGWRPTYLASSLSGGGALAGNMPAAQAANVKGIGWLPGIDVSPSRQPPRSPSQQRCLDLLRKGGLTPSQYNDFIATYITCDALFLYEAALKATNGSSDAAKVTAAIEALGDGYQSPSALDGHSRYGRGRHDGPSFARPFAWDAGCKCFAYTSEPGFPMS